MSTREGIRKTESSSLRESKSMRERAREGGRERERTISKTERERVCERERDRIEEKKCGWVKGRTVCAENQIYSASKNVKLFIFTTF